MIKLLLSLGIAVLVNATIAKEFVEVNGIVAMEAENATSVGWKTIPGGVQDAGSGSVTFKITFKQTGKYYVWVRGATGANGCGNDLANDCFVKFNGNYLKLMDYSGSAVAIGLRWPNSTCKQMQWHQGPKTEPDHPKDWTSISSRPVYANVTSAGTHTLSLIHRSTGLMIDRVVMQLNKSTKPSGIGPAETAKGGSTDILMPTRVISSSRQMALSPVYAIDGSSIGTSHRLSAGVVLRATDGRLVREMGKTVRIRP